MMSLNLIIFDWLRNPSVFVPFNLIFNLKLILNTFLPISRFPCCLLSYVCCLSYVPSIVSRAVCCLLSYVLSFVLSVVFCVVCCLLSVGSCVSGDIYEILIDPTKKRLWDQGYDREELDQRAEYAKQGGGGGGGGHYRGGGGGFSGFY